MLETHGVRTPRRLQFGHSQKAVENQTHAMLVFVGDWLQVGHSQKAVENKPSATTTNRLTTSFNSATAKRPWRTRRTSRPWDVRDCFNSATAKRPWRTWRCLLFKRLRKSLQFGHSQKAVENTGRCCEPFSRRCSFNSATAKRPWRTEKPLERRTETDALQFGHSQKAVENLNPRHTFSAPCSASIRPQPKGRGERVDLGTALPKGESFNSATAKRPWRTPAAALRAYARRHASIRPQPKGRGEQHTDTQRYPSKEIASIRPQPKGRGELQC